MVVRRHMRNQNNHLRKTYKDNLSKATLLPLVVLSLPLIRNLLVIQANLPLSKLSLVSSKVLILDKPVNHSLMQINLTSSIPKFLAKLPNQLVSQLSSILNLLGKLVNLKHSWANHLPSPFRHLV